VVIFFWERLFNLTLTAYLRLAGPYYKHTVMYSLTGNRAKDRPTSIPFTDVSIWWNCIHFGTWQSETEWNIV